MLQRLIVITAIASAACSSRGSAPAAQSVGQDLPQLEGVADQIATQLTARGVRRVGVLEMRSSHGNVLGRYVSDKLVLRLKLHGDLDILERSSLASVVDEQALSQSGLVGESAIEVGKLVGADALVVGNVTVLANTVDVTVRAVETNSGRVVAVADTVIAREALAEYITTQAPPAAAAPLTVATIFIGERKKGDHWEETVVRDGTTMSSGDGLKIIFETNRAAYVYALLLDSSGKGSVIFPQRAIEASNRVRGGRQVEIPPGNQWFFLDDKTGTERIYVLASLEPMPQIQTLVAKLEALGLTGNDIQSDKEVASFVGKTGDVIKRGIGGVRKGHTQRVQLSDGGVVEQVVDMISGTGVVVRAVTFVHQ